MKAFLRALIVPVSVLVCLVAGPRGLSAQGPISLTPTFCIDALHPCVSTYHNDNSRDGVNPNETTFTPTTKFANLTHVVYPTDGLIYAQPLYIKSLDSSNHRIGICNAPANIVFVATENNSVYAFDTTPPVSPNPCWQTNLNQSGDTAIAWALDSNSYGSPSGTAPAGSAVLRAYKALPDSTHCPTGQVCNQLWDSTALPNSATVMPGAVKFTVPTIVDGYIFVAGGAPGYFGATSTACPPPPPNNGVPTSLCDGQLTILH